MYNFLFVTPKLLISAFMIILTLVKKCADEEWKNWSSCTVLVGMQNNATTVEKFGGSLRASHRLTI